MAVPEYLQKKRAERKAEEEEERKRQSDIKRTRYAEATAMAEVKRENAVSPVITATAGKHTPIKTTTTNRPSGVSVNAAPVSVGTQASGRQAQLEDSRRRTQEIQWEKEAEAKRNERTDLTDRSNAVEYLNKISGIAPKEESNVKAYENNYSDAAVKNAQDRSAELKEMAAKLQEEIKYSENRHSAYFSNKLYDKAEKEKNNKRDLESQLANINGQLKYYDKVMGNTTVQRVGNALKGIAATTGAAAGVLGETIETAAKDSIENLRNKELQNELWEEQQRLNSLGMSAPERAAEMKKFREENADEFVKNAVDPNSRAMQNYRNAMTYTEKATEGLEGGAKVLADTGISVAESVMRMPLAVVNPALPLVLAGIKGAAGKAYELNERGIASGESLWRGIASGVIEAATEKIPLDNLVDMVKKGGKGFIREMLEQAGIEGTEEGISYIGNYIVDKAAKDPEATFSLQELATSILQGGLSGMFFGVGGGVTNALTGNTQERVNPTAEHYKGTQAVMGQNGVYQDYEGIKNVSSNENKVKEQTTYTTDDGKTEEATRTQQRKTALKMINAQNGQSQQIYRQIMANYGFGKTMSKIDAAAKRAGSEVVYYASDDNSEGYYEDGKIYFNVNKITGTEKDFWRVFKHELTHRLEGTDAYSLLMNGNAGTNLFADFLMKNGYTATDESGNTFADVTVLENEIRDLYRKNGVELTEQKLQNEMIARFVEESELFTSEESIRRLVEGNPTVAHRIYYWIKDMVRKFRGTEYEKELINAERMYLKAIEQAGRGQGNKGTERENLFVRERDRGNIRLAEFYENGGTPEEIWQAVKMKRDRRGDWITEIDDSKAVFDPKGKTSGKLGEVFKHDVLYTLYPKSRDIGFAFADLNNANARYIPAKNMIILDNKYKNIALKGEAEEKIIHELQHYLQYNENRNVGGSNYLAYIYLMNRAYEKNKNNRNFQRLKNYRQRIEFLEDDIIAEHGGGNLGDLVFEAYRAIEGEEEARKAEERKKNKSYERRNMYPEYGGRGIQWTWFENDEEMKLRDKYSNILAPDIANRKMRDKMKKRGVSIYDYEGIQKRYKLFEQFRDDKKRISSVWDMAEDRNENNGKNYEKMSRTDRKTIQNEEVSEGYAQNYRDKGSDFGRSKMNNEEKKQAGDGLFFNAENGNKQFSFKRPIEKKNNLIAMHNMDSERMEFLLNMKGMAMPSIAVTNANFGYDAFGDVSIIFGKENIDPERDGNYTYSGDAWTEVAEEDDGETLEEMLDSIMERTREETDFGLSEESLRFYLVRKFKNIDEIKEESKKLKPVNAKNYRKAMDETRYRMRRVLEKRDGEEKLRLEKAIVDAAKRGGSEGDILISMLENDVSNEARLSDDILKLFETAKKIPEEYFESKPQRIVRIDEMKAFIIPDDMDEEIKNRLKELGKEVVEYEAGNLESRKQAVNSVPDVKFSFKRDSIENTNAPSLNTKAERHLKYAANSLMEKFKGDMGISRFRNSREMGSIVRNFAKDCAEKGYIDSAEAERVFEELFDRGMVENREFYEEYKDVAGKIRGTQLYDGTLGSEAPEMRRKYYGNIHLVTNPRALKIDSFYQELCGMYPELFSEEITDVSDQLIRMKEVLDSIRVSEESVRYSYDNMEEAKALARGSFDSSLRQFEEELNDVMIYASQKEEEKKDRQERKELAEFVKDDVATAKSMYEKRRSAKEEYNKLAEKELIGDREKAVMDQLWKKEITMEQIPKGVNKNGIEKVYKAYRTWKDQDAVIKMYKKSVKDEYAEEARNAIANSDRWKDKSAGWKYSTEIMERNFEDITQALGKETGNKRRSLDAKHINETYFKAIHHNEAESTRMKNEYTERIKKLDLGTKEKYRVSIRDDVTGFPKTVDVSESSLVQLFGEKMITEAELKAVGADVAKIKHAVSEFRSIYDELIDKTNVVLVRNGYEPVPKRKEYFPHFTEAKPDTMLGKMASFAGINIVRDELPTDIAGLTHTFRPGKRWVGNFLQRVGTSTDYDALKGFDRYLDSVADVIWHTDDIQRLRALENELRYKYSDSGTKERLDSIRNDDSLTPEEKQSKTEDILKNQQLSHLPNLVTSLRNYTDSLAGKKSIGDRTWEQFLGRGMYNTIKSMENKISANMVAVNPGSWLTNFIPITQAMGEVRTDAMLNALWDTVKGQSKTDGFAERSDFIVNRKGSEAVSRNKVEKAQEFLTKPFTAIDEFTSEVVTRALYYDHMRTSKNDVEALEYANDRAARIMADRSKGAMPTVFNNKNPVSKLFTMFQVEVNNQYRYMFKDVPSDLKEKGLGMIAMAMFKMWLGAWLYNYLYEEMTGRKAAFDPIDLMMTAGKDIMSEDKTLSAALMDTGKNVLEEVPFVGGVLGGGRIPISSALPDVENVITAGAGLISGDMNSKKALTTLAKEAAKPGLYIIPPVGGGQAKKTLEGIGVLAKGGEYTYENDGDAKLRYAVEDPSVLDIGKALIFGKSSLPEYKDYMERGFKALSAEQTKKYHLAVEAGISYPKYMEALSVTKGVKSDKRPDGSSISPGDKYEKAGKGKSASLKMKEAIDGIEGLSKEQREVLYDAMGVSEKVW